MNTFAIRPALKPRLFRMTLRAVAIAALVQANAAYATDGYFLNGNGAKAKGAGGVAVAMPMDALAIATNPASATQLGHRFDFGFEIFVPKRGASINGNLAGLNGRYSADGANPFLLPEGAYIRPLSDTVSVGLAINGNGGMNTQYDQNPFASFGASGPAGVNLKQIFITPTIAVEFAEGHSIGVSPILMLQSFEARGIQPFVAASSDPANFTNRGADWSTGGGVRVGYLGKVSDAISFGAFYQSKVWAGRFGKYAGLFAEKGGFDVPASWGAGIAVKAGGRLTIGADFKRIQYSGIKSVGTPLAPLFSNVPFGADTGPGFGWHDISVIKLGANYAASEKLTLRAGYGHSENPVPGTQTLLNILAPGVVTDHFTGGATVKLKSDLELSAYVMHAPKNVVHGLNSIPGTYGGGEADVHLSETATGVSLGLVF